MTRPSVLERIAVLETKLDNLERTLAKHGLLLERIEDHVAAQQGSRKIFGTLWENARTLIASSGTAAIVAWWLRHHA